MQQIESDLLMIEHDILSYTRRRKYKIEMEDEIKEDDFYSIREAIRNLGELDKAITDVELKTNTIKITIY